MKNLKILTVVFAGMALFSACQKDAFAPADAINESTSAVTDRCCDPCDVDPVLYETGQGGNVTCDQVGAYDYTSGRIDGGYQCGGTTGPITWYTVSYNDDGECVAINWEWTGEGSPCGVSVIMKGGNAANVYTYPEGCTSGSYLVSPTNSSGNPAALSNITFCWNVCNEVECTYETGWGGNYAGGGKAWWYYFDTYGPATQTIYAGKQPTDGTVTWNAFTNTFTIDLGSWSLQDVEEPVKAEGYNTLPTKKPVPGLFTLYKGDDLSFMGNGSRYYAIHLDLQLCE